MRVGLIAHDSKKAELVAFARAHHERLARHELFATGHSGQRVHDATGLKVTLFMSGPLGGDQQMGSRIAEGGIDCLFFLRDPLFAHPHEPDVHALLRLCDVRNIPVAANRATAEWLAQML